MNVEFYDTTLRDGAQAEGISFSKMDKAAIFALLDNLGIDFVEGGDPASNPKDKAFFAENANDKLVAFGSTRRKDCSAVADGNLIALADCGAKTVCIFGKASAMQVKRVLNVTKDDNLNMIGESIGYLVGCGKRVIYDAEHFFDGYQEDENYAMQTLMTAYMAGAETLVLCDTNGGTFPSKIAEITAKVCDTFVGAKIGVHCHNDSGTAVAASIAAYEAGATHIQGTLLGFGERCGNANLSTIICNLALKDSVETNVNLKELTRTANAVAEIANVKLPPETPYVGAAAFAHKAGMHSDAVLKEPDTFEHINPEDVGNRRHILLSEVAGRSAVSAKLKQHFPSLDKSNPKTKEILDAMKQLEMSGYQFEGADGSFVLLAEKLLGTFKPSFELGHYEIKATKPEGINTAEVTVKVGDKTATAAANGNGPVNALDKALRTALTDFFPEIGEVALVDYKVRVIDSNSATGAMVRVLITSRDKTETWATVGVSTDIIEASWNALVDSLEYKLSGQGRIVL